MASCSLPYIQKIDSSLISDEGKEILQDIHFDAMQTLLTSKKIDATASDPFLFTPFVTKDKRKVLLMSLDTKTFNTQFAKISELNKEYLVKIASSGVEGLKENVTPDLIKVVELPLYAGGAPKEVVVVNLSPFIDDAPIDDNLISDPAEYNNYFQSGLFEATDMKYTDSVLLEAEKNKDKIFEIFQNVKEKLDTFKSNTLQSKKDHKYDWLKGTLTNLANHLNPPNETLNEDDYLARLTYYFKNSGNILNTLKNDFNEKHKIFDRIKSLTNQTPNYTSEVAALGAYLTEAGELMRLILPMEEIIKQLNVQSNKGFWKNRNTIFVEKELLKLVVDKNKLPEIKKYLGEIANITSISDVVLNFNNILGGNLTTEIQSIFDNSIINDQLSTDSLSTYVKELTEFKDNLKESYYDLYAQIFYNQEVKRINKENKAILNAKGEDTTAKDADGNFLYELKDFTENDERILNPNIRKSALTKEQLKAQLFLAESDITIGNAWAASGASVEDAVVNLTHEFITTEIRKKELKNNKLNTIFEKFIKDIDLKRDSPEMLAYNKLIKKEITYVNKHDNIVMLEEGDESEGDTIEKYGKKFKVKKGLAYKSKYNEEGYWLDKKAFNATLTDVSRELRKLISTGNFRLTEEEINTQFPDYFDHLLNADLIVHSSSVPGTYVYKSKGSRTALNISSKQIRTALKSGFYNSSFELASPEAIQQVIEKNTDPSDKNVLEKFLAKNLDTVNTYDLNWAQTLESRYQFYGFNPVNADSPLGSIEVQNLSNGEFETALFVEVNGTLTIEEKFKDGNYTIKKLGYAFQTFKDKYINKDFVELQEKFKADPKLEQYYNFIYEEQYKVNNKKLAGQALNYGLLPFISDQQHKPLINKFNSIDNATKTVLDYFKSFKYKDIKTIPRTKVIDGKRTFIDDNDNPTDVASSFIQKQDIFDNPLNEIQAAYTKDTGDNQLDDLFMSTFLFSFAANEYETMNELASSMPILKSIILGNETVGITARKKKLTSSTTQSLLRKAMGTLATDKAERSTETMLQMIDQLVFDHDDTDINAGSFSVKKIVQGIKGLINYQVLALNFQAAITNTTLGTTSNFISTLDTSNELTAKDIRKAYKEYGANSGGFVKDLNKNNISETSLLTQLASYFDALKGDKEDGRGFINRQNKTDSRIQRTLFATSAAPEHLNQIVLMQALLNTYKVGGKNSKGEPKVFADYIEHTSDQAFTFKEDEMIKDGYNPEELILDVTKKIARVNEEAHGQYDKLRKSRIQNHAYLSLAALFSKWIYPGYKARFRDGFYARDSNTYMDQGYLKTYFRFLMKDVSDMNEDWSKISFLEDTLKYVKKEKLKAFALPATFVIKQAAGVFDRISGQLFSKRYENFNEFLYGPNSMEELTNMKMQILRANLEITVFFSTMVVGMMFKGLADDLDDDETLKKAFLQNLELQSKRLNADLGFYLVFTNPSFAGDRLRAKLADPFAVTRLYDNNYSVLKALTMGEWEEDKKTGESNFNWYIDDVYERKGPGYKKGDSKTVRKLEKSVFSPINQLYKLIYPEDQLAFMELMYK